MQVPERSKEGIRSPYWVMSSCELTDVGSENELGSSGRARSTFNLQVLSLVPHTSLLVDYIFAGECAEKVKKNENHLKSFKGTAVLMRTAL